MTDPAQATDAPSREEKKESLPVWQESLLLLAIALVLAIGIKYFFVQALYIPSPSMEPMLIKNDRILVQKVSYWGGGSPQRGDVVVFKDPGGGFVADDLVVGKVWALIWPLSRAKWVHVPATFEAVPSS